LEFIKDAYVSSGQVRSSGDMVDMSRNIGMTGEMYNEGWGDIIDSSIIMGPFEEDHRIQPDFGTGFMNPMNNSSEGNQMGNSVGNPMYSQYIYGDSMNAYNDNQRSFNSGNVGHGFYGNRGYSSDYGFNLNSYGYNHQNMMVYNNNAINIKVPMAPIRSHSLETRRPTAPLLLPFHHKNDNRIIPQTFTSHTGIMPHYSIEEIQESKNLFIKKHSELDFDNITVVELKGFLREFSLASGGRKDDLISRIRQVYDYLINENNGIMNGENPFILYGNNGYTNETY
jgi:hypothetical protein